MPILWKGVTIGVESATGANKTITAITKANPGVVTSTSHGLANGNYVRLSSIIGMSQVNNRIFRVANQAANTFELEGEDTTLYDTFTSGIANQVTFGTNVVGTLSLSASGGNFDFIDTTTVQDNVKTQIPGTAEPATYTLSQFFDLSDTAQAALRAASRLQSKKGVLITYANANKIAFDGYVGASGLPTGEAQGLVLTEVVLTMFGNPTFYIT